MKAFGRLSALAVGCAVLGSLSVTPRAQAVEPAQAFVDGLRERGLYDYALEYLDRAGSNPLVPENFKQKILYEQGVTLVEQAGQLLSSSRQEKKLDAAQAKLSAFIEAHGENALAAEARNQLAKVLMARGRMLKRRTKTLLRAQEEQRTQLLGQARQYFDDAQHVFDESRAHYAEAIRKSKKDTPTAKADRDTLRRQWIQSRLWIAETIYERAGTHPADSADYRKEITATSEMYKALYEKNRRSLAGLHAHLWEGRCYQDLGQLDKAARCYEDLTLHVADLPVFRKLISEAHRRLAECFIHQAKYDEAIDKCSDWLAQARGAESREGEWLAVAYQLALAHAEKGRSLKSGSSTAKRHLRTARDWARETGRWTSEVQQPAQLLFAELGPTIKIAKPKSFDEAYNAATGAIDLMKSSQGVIHLARRNNPEQVDQLQEQLNESRAVAFDSFRAALAMADVQTDIEKINRARYYLCYLNYDSGRFYDAAVLGEFLARKYPKNAHAREAAKIAMAAYQRLYFHTDGNDKVFETARLVAIANYMIRRWPDEKEADDAYLMLVNFTVRQGKIRQAEQYVAKISPERRASAQIQVGRGYWNDYLRALGSDPSVRPDQAALDTMKGKAQSALEAGIEEMRDGPITATTASAALSLVQIYLDTSHYKQAIDLLEDDQLGPLPLVASRSTVVSYKGFAEETYKAALRAYISIRPPQSQQALDAMDALERLAGRDNDPQAAERLTKIFIGLGSQLQRVIEDLDRQGRTGEAARVATDFEVFLDRVSRRPTGNTWVSRHWIAQTYDNLGAGLDDGGALTKQTKTYYKKAIAAYEAILTEAARDRQFAPSPGALLHVKIRLADSLRKARRHAEAIERIGGILDEKPNMLQAQVVAARLYQDRGDYGEPKWYYHAIKGGNKDEKTGKNQIWGWAKLSRIAYRYPQYRGTFYDARYNMNLCRLQYAMTQPDEKKNATLRSARDDLTVMDLSYFDDAWIEWRPKFDRLLKDVQKNMKITPVGFDKNHSPNLSKASAERKTAKK